MKIISLQEAKEQGLSRYFTGISCKEGHTEERSVSSRSCLACQRNKNNQLYSVGYYTNYRDANRLKRREQNARWDKNNKGKVNAKTAKRHTAKMHRMPKWLSAEQKKDIKDFYVMASELESVFPWKQHVDHIVPLQGKTVSGLHVSWNLQIIPAVWNIAKGNRFES